MVQLVITYILSNSLDPIRPEQNVGPVPGPNCLQRLPADDMSSKVLMQKELEDLKVLRRSPDLFNNVKTGQGLLQLIMEQILFLPYTFWSSDLNNLMNNPSNSPVISEKKMLR